MTYPNDQGNAAGAIPVWQRPWSYANITTNASTQVKTGAGVFGGISVNTAGTESTATVYDGTGTDGTKLGTFGTAGASSILPLGGFAFAVGLFIVTAGSAAADLTVAFA